MFTQSDSDKVHSSIDKLLTQVDRIVTETLSSRNVVSTPDLTRIVVSRTKGPDQCGWRAEAKISFHVVAES